jgi:hypothetical protein
MKKRRFILLAVGLLSPFSLPPNLSAVSIELEATGCERRIDLSWHLDSEIPGAKFDVFRASAESGDFAKINRTAQDYTVFSDFIGENQRSFSYRIEARKPDGTPLVFSNTVSATTREQNDPDFLTSIQQVTFRYFWDFAHPVSGLAREGLRHDRKIVTSGGSGFAVMSIIVGVEREFITRSEAVGHILKMVRFLQDTCPRYHGMWSHWIDGTTGRTIPFSAKDDGGDIVESSFLIQGLLCARQYFDQTSPEESELRERITLLWEEMEWDWYLREPEGRVLYWHWSPVYGWEMNHAVRGFNECMATYLLAMASPTHAIPVDCYYDGWVHDPESYVSGREDYGIRQFVGPPLGGPLFFTHYSYTAFNPRHITDNYCNYFENNRNITRIHRAYCMDNPHGFEGYGPNIWGLTASQNPSGYKAHSPTNDDGTIAPTAAISAMPYAPSESLDACRTMYHTLGDKIWGPFGFYDAFNLEKNWVSDSYLAIDQGPIIIMIENHRTGLLWKLLDRDPAISSLLSHFSGTNRNSSTWEFLP